MKNILIFTAAVATGLLMLAGSKVNASTPAACPGCTNSVSVNFAACPGCTNLVTVNFAACPGCTNSVSKS